MGRLCVSRRKGQQFCIGDDVVITVRAIGSNQVSLIIEAPDAVQVDRQEVRVRKEQEKAKP